jgi:hypothetical protein
MLPYQEDGQKLEQLLRSLFDGESAEDDGIDILRIPIPPIILGSCCIMSYASYNGNG